MCVASACAVVAAAGTALTATLRSLHCRSAASRPLSAPRVTMIRTAAASLPSTRAITRVAVAHTQTAVAAALPAAALPATHCSSRGLASRASAAAAAAPRAPSRAQLLSTYRLLRRSIFQSFYTASQYASYDELARDSNAIAGRSPGAAYRKEAFAKESNQPHLAFARKRSEPWMKQLKESDSLQTDNCDSDGFQREQRWGTCGAIRV